MRAIGCIPILFDNKELNYVEQHRLIWGADMPLSFFKIFPKSELKFYKEICILDPEHPEEQILEKDEKTKLSQKVETIISALELVIQLNK